MNKNEKGEGGISLMDAVEALSTIAETHWEEEPVFMEEGPIEWDKADWLRSRSKEEVVFNVKEIFKVILNHIKNYYHSEHAGSMDSKTLDGIKSIMLLVGEAARKIDRHTELFKEKTMRSVTQLREYKQLQDFYRRKISRTIDEALLGKWILGLTQRTFKEHEHGEGIESFETKHVFVDLDSVKKDTEYELFFIRKEDGTRFFSPRLIRNIKLVCDFGSYLGQEKEKDPLVDQLIWDDRLSLSVAESIYQIAKPILATFYPEIVKAKKNEWIGIVNMAIIALMLANSKMRLISSGSSKGCATYLSDFQRFLREAIEHRDYQQLIALPPKQMLPHQLAAQKIIDSFLEGIMNGIASTHSISSYIRYLIDQANQIQSHEHQREAIESGFLWSRLASDHTALHKYMRRHPNGPLNKVLNLLEEGDYQAFDPYLQQQMPEWLFNINAEGRKIGVQRLQTPTSQAFIQEAKVINEFLCYLRTLGSQEKVLLINFQDRTSWKEHARSNILEDLQNGEGFAEKVCVATLPKDTEFYLQEAPYQNDNHMHVFKKHLLEHLVDEHAGFFIPIKLREGISPKWIEATCSAINRIFFSNKNVLIREARLDFIELFYLFLELKLLDSSDAKTLYLVCKDGVDIAPAAAANLYVFLKLMTVESINPADIERLTEMLYVPPLMCRERMMQPERFQRMLGAIKVIENVRREMGADKFVKVVQEAFGSLIRADLLTARPVFPRIEQ